MRPPTFRSVLSDRTGPPAPAERLVVMRVADPRAPDPDPQQPARRCNPPGHGGYAAKRALFGPPFEERP